MSASAPLAGLNIVVTRPREQAVALAQRIEQAGGRPLLFPLLEIAAADPQPLQDAIARLADFDLAVFVSPNAVRYAAPPILAAGPLPSGLKLGTIGQGSARALGELGAQHVIAPQGRSDSEALLALPELQQMKGRHVAIFRGDGGRELLGDTLQARGAVVEYVTCYRRSPAQPQSPLPLEVDAYSVTSSEALRHLWQLAAGAAREALLAIPLFVPHPRIATAALELGWRDVETAAGGDDGLLSGLIAWTKHRNRP